MASGSDYISLEAPPVDGAREATDGSSQRWRRPFAVFVTTAFVGTALLCAVSFSPKTAPAKPIEVPSLADLPKMQEKARARKAGPVVTGSLSELPGFEEFYMKKKNLTSITPKKLFGEDVCARTTSKDAIYPEASIFYHGTLVDFSGYPFSPSWFAAELPPANKLAMHVPMAWMCFGKGGYEVPGQYWLKVFKIKESEDLPEEVDAETFYSSLGDQAGEAKEYCACDDDRKGFIIDADAVDEQPEYIMCNPERDMDYVTQYIGSSSWDEDDGRKLILDVGEYGKYSLDCDDPMGSFEVIEEPSPAEEDPDSPEDGNNCCRCCVDEGGACEVGDICVSPLTGNFALCNDAGKQYPNAFYGCDE